MQGGAATLGAAYPGRFVLGIGISHAPMAEGSGQAYEKPLDRMAHYLDGMDAAAAAAPATEIPVARVLAALRPAERVAAERGHTHDSATHHRGRPPSPDALLASPDTTTLANCKGATNKRSMEIPLVAAAMRAETTPLGDRNTYWPDPGSVPAIFADICRSGLKVPSKSMDRPRPESRT
jgi:hypothetical protein